MNAIEALTVMKAGCEVEQLFHDSFGCREMFKLLDDGETIGLFLPDFNQGHTDILSAANFLKVHEDAQFVLFERYKVT